MLRNVRQLAGHPCRMVIQVALDGVSQRAMVCENRELTSLQKIGEMLDGKEDGEQLSVIGTVLDLWLA